ncbi:unnamed protein product (macronuclear) [Paramecium tetraurelia]|uniref:Uncharacterized protein n=1 Tax=Paramecium tetraurelia TaxID=5888 RepID=A0CVT1_PARTE|nr:uncharacterized protein GSPATT00039059001 [Paramecium tetraurelia]CAK74898.1 unnamed protein product [Paramecium tetraurelia]|eukprot:XP_001442295.1 hypothetical protein (macronuclear) [Paramecium tetraurelia strain d4-2]
MDDVSILNHHVLLYKSQIDNMKAYYSEKIKELFQLVQQGIQAMQEEGRNSQWEEHKQNMDSSAESSKFREVFEQLRILKEKNLKVYQIVEKTISNAESVQSQQGILKRLSSFLKSGIKKELKEIEEKEKVLALLQINLKQTDKKFSLMPINAFQNGLKSFVVEYDCESFLKLFF